MDDKAIIFFSILMILVFLYRIFLSICLLVKKKNIIDEKFYITLFYCSLVGIFVLFTNWLIVGGILVALLPIVLTIYVSVAKSRVYWIINGWNITESTFVNKLIEYDERYSNTLYRISHFKFSKKKKESKVKIEFLNLNYNEKESLLKIVKDVLKENVKKSNKNEIIAIVMYSIMILILVWFIIFALFL